MGLDTVELVIGIEEAFGITIADRDAEKILTVGDAYRYGIQRVQHADFAPCRSSVMFYRLRRALIGTFGVRRDRVRPTAVVEELIQRHGRREHWERLGRALGVEMPRLVRPASIVSSVTRFVFAGLGVCSIVRLAVFCVRPDLAVPAGLGLLAALLVALLVSERVTRPFAIEFGADWQTVRGLVSSLVAQELSQNIPSGQTWDRVSAWETLVAVVSDQAGVDPETLTEDTSFVYDLGLD
jgi:acyl carrier protein